MNLINKTVFNKEIKVIFNKNFNMIDVFVEINSDSRTAKYKEIKQMQFAQQNAEYKSSKQFKKLAQILKKQFNFAKIFKQILNTSIEIRFQKLLDIFSKLSQQMFRNIIDDKIKIVSKKRKVVVQSKVIKKKKVHVDFIKFNSTKSMHLKKIVTCVIFLRFMYTIVCSTMNMIIEKIKIKAMFNNDAEINCMSKKLTNAAQLSVR